MPQRKAMWDFDYDVTRKPDDVWDVSKIREIPPYSRAEPVPEVDPHISSDEFHDTYRQQLRPVIMRDAVADWTACERWQDPDYLIDRAGDHQVEVTEGLILDHILKVLSDPSYLPRFVQGTLSMSLARYLGLLTVVDNHEILYARNTDVPPELEEDLGTIPCYEGDFRAKSMFLGTRTFSDIHEHDGEDALVCQISGPKEFILFPPDNLHGETLYPLPGANWSRVRLFDLDLDRFPKFAQSKPRRAVLRAGDVLYLPNPWWHAVVALEPDLSCTVTHWFPPERFSFDFQPTRSAEVSPLRESPSKKFADKDWDHPPKWRHLFSKMIDSKLNTV